MSNNNIASGEGRKLLQKSARLAFVAELQAIGGTKVSFGSSIMPRERWARCLTVALFTTGASMDADECLVVLDSDLGNASQLGTALVKEEVIKVEAVEVAAGSLAKMLAERAAAAKPSA